MIRLRLAICILLLFLGLFMFISAAVGVNRFKKPLNRLHAAALGDTLGLFLILLSLVIWRGWTFVSLKLIVVLVFFWLASPVSGHIIAQMEATTNEDLGEIDMLSMGSDYYRGGKDEGSADTEESEKNKEDRQS